MHRTACAGLPCSPATPNGTNIGAVEHPCRNPTPAHGSVLQRPCTNVMDARRTSRKDADSNGLVTPRRGMDLSNALCFTGEVHLFHRCGQHPLHVLVQYEARRRRQFCIWMCVPKSEMYLSKQWRHIRHQSFALATRMPTSRRNLNWTGDGFFGSKGSSQVSQTGSTKIGDGSLELGIRWLEATVQC